jgi:hypothetical protein
VARTRLSCWPLPCHRGRPHRTSVNVRRNLESFPFMLYLHLLSKFITAVTAMFSFWTIHSVLPYTKEIQGQATWGAPEYCHVGWCKLVLV